MTKPKAKAEAELKKFEPTLDVVINGKTREVKMTFGLLNDLARAVGGLEEIQLVMMDNDRLMGLLNLVVADRDDKGRINHETSIDLSVGDAISLDTFEELSTWTLGHTMSFFVRRMKSVGAASQLLGPEIRALNKLASGFED